jgi:hypothetical protein
MPNALDVAPEKWSQIQILFDDNEYSVISGVFEDDPQRRLGERWNGQAGTQGFPVTYGRPVYHVVPRFLEIPLLHGLLDELARNENRQVGLSYPDWIVAEITNRYRAQARMAAGA